MPTGQLGLDVPAVTGIAPPGATATFNDEANAVDSDTATFAFGSPLASQTKGSQWKNDASVGGSRAIIGVQVDWEGIEPGTIQLTTTLKFSPNAVDDVSKETLLTRLNAFSRRTEQFRLTIPAPGDSKLNPFAGQPDDWTVAVFATGGASGSGAPTVRVYEVRLMNAERGVVTVQEG